MILWEIMAARAETIKAGISNTIKLAEVQIEATRATYAPIVMSSAWAKFGKRITARVKVKPMAIKAYRLPTCRERMSESTNNDAGNLPILYHKNNINRPHYIDLRVAYKFR